MNQVLFGVFLKEKGLARNVHKTVFSTESYLEIFCCISL